MIKLAGLDYVVEKVKSYDEEGEEIGSYHTRYFDKDGVKHNLGAGLKEQYTVLQNYEAFDFLDTILTRMSKLNVRDLPTVVKKHLYAPILIR